MTKQKKRRVKSFRQTVVLLVWACVSVPVVILSTYQIRDDYQQQLESDQRELALETERTALVISQELRQIMSDLDRISSDGSVIRSISMPILSPVSVKHLQEFLGAHPSASSVMLIDEEMFPVEVLPSWALTEDLSDYQSFIADTITSPESIVDPRARLYVPPSSRDAEVHISFVRPILGANDSLTKPFEVKGILFTKVSISRLVSQLGLMPEEQRAFTFLFRNKALYNVDQLMEGTWSDSNYRADISLGRGETPIAIELGKSSQGVLKRVLQGYRIQAVVACIFFVIVFLSIRWIAEKLTRPLRTLSKVTEDMTTRGFDLNDEHERINTDNIHYQEFTEVFRLLGDMEDTIGHQIKQLNDANFNLEQKVAERTSELERNLHILDRKKESLRSLVQFSLEIQQMDNMEDACQLAATLAHHVAGERLGIDIRRSENFNGYQNFHGLEVENRHYLYDHSQELSDFSSLLRVAKNSPWLQFVTIGSSTPSYQGYIVLEKTDESEGASEILQVLCTMLSSAFRQHNLTEKLHRLAHTDSLTGIANRYYISGKITEKTNRFDPSNPDTHFGVFVIDVNGLKQVNDQYGHQYGDDMLNTVAHGLKNTARENDTVARVGGDEFYVLLEHANAQVCENFAARLEASCQELEIYIGDKAFPISFSFGYATTDNDPVKDLLKLADQRMYEVKQNHYQKLSR